MKLALEVTANAPIDRVWDILVPGYVNAGDWASSVYISHPCAGQAKVPGAPAATGKPHPRKLKADASKKGIAARQAMA